MKRKRGYLQEINFQKKRRRQRKLLFVLGLILVFISAAVYSLFYSGIFAISSFEISDYKDIDKGQIDGLINGYLSKRLLLGLIARQSNFLLISSENLGNEIKGVFTEIKDLEFDAGLFKNSLKVSFEKRETAGVWCFVKSEKCFFFDPEGYLFKEAEKNKLDLAVIDENSPSDIRESIEDRQLFQKIIEAGNALEALDFIAYSSFYVPENSFNDFWIKTSEGWNIYLDKKTNVQEQIIALKELLDKKISLEKRSKLQYMDLRIQGRIYYK